MVKYTKVSRLASVPGIGVDKMGNAADALQDSSLLRLENLDTDIAPPKIAIETTREGVDLDENNSYLPFLGQDRLRIAATNRVSEVSGQDYNWKTQCVISAGGMSGILNCLLALVEPGDEVIVTDPTYAGIINRIHLCGGKPVFVPLIPTPEGWRFDTAAFEKAMSPKVKLVVLSPGMPHGHIFTHNEWETVTKIIVKADAWLLYDAAMEKILYDQRTVIHPASFSGMKERTITVGAASKELRMIGWRIGWIVGPEEIMNDIGLVSMANVVCQTGITMSGAAAGLETKENGLNEALKTWQGRRDRLLKEFDGLPIIPPHGGWSMLMDVTHFGMDAPQASDKLFKVAKVAATPMLGWGKQAEKYVRFVFSNEPEERLIGIGIRVKKALL